MPAERIQLEAGIDAMEAQRSLLGDAVVDAAVAGLRVRLAALGVAGEPEPELGLLRSQTLRQVSILFLDVVGSTMLSQRLDPEEVSGVMDGVLRRGTVIVRAHGGRVLQYSGDSILAAFGSRAAVEDDAERAVRCGLRLLDLGREVGFEVDAAYGHAGCDVRVGIHTGSALLGGDSGAASDDSAIRGVAVNIAARMEQTAPVGALRISRDTYLQVRGLFEMAVQEPLAVKGIDDPLVTYLVLRPKPRNFRIESRGIEGVATRMVGRDDEFEVLQDAFKRLLVERQLMRVSVVAEAGLGKSRLLDEFQTWIDDHPETVCVFRGRATPQTQGQPFGLLRDIVAGRLQLSDDDTLDEAKAKIEHGSMPLFAEEPDFAEAHAHLLGHLIGLDWKDSPHLRSILDDPKQIGSRGRHAAALMFRRVGERDGSSVILQLEDLHWADDETLDFLNHLAKVDDDVPLLMLSFARPVLYERRPDWNSADGRHQRIDLAPLDKAASSDLVDQLLGKLPEIPAALRELITSGAEGNPFYMEELVRMLIDQRAIDTTEDPWRLNADRLMGTKVPSTLTGVLQARLDGLPADERLSLQMASVIGHIFWDGALMALDPKTHTTLPRLVQRKLALPRREAEPDGLREFAFKHALLHQVTYGTVLKSQRRALHGALAHWLAAQSRSDSARAGDFLGLTARHYVEAGDAANGVEFHARAAEHAAGRLAHGVTLEHVTAALALLDRAGDGQSQAPMRWRLLRARERTLEIQGQMERQGEVLDAMDRIAETLGDRAQHAFVAYRRGLRASYTARWAEAAQFARHAVALTDAALTNRTDRAGSEHDDDGLHELRLTSLRMVGTTMLLLGRWFEAQELLEQTLEEARLRDLVRLQGFCLSSLSLLAERRDDRTRALGLGHEALDLFRRGGDRRNEAVALGMVGGIRLDLGDLAAARRDLEESLRLRRLNGERTAECVALCNLSTLALWQGDDASALSLARGALGAAVTGHARNWEAVALINLGDAEAALGRAEPATLAYTQARSVAEEFCVGRHFDASAGLARLALAQLDTEGALREVNRLLSQAGVGAKAAADAGEAAGNFDGAIWPRLIELTIHRVLAAAGDLHASVWLQRAHSALMAQAEAVSDPALRQMFLTHIPHHREIVSLWSRRPLHSHARD